ncbi:MAG TPA: cupin domain-containing protein [Armatimonadota bacterium]|jgi:quercetin dioxygenase-like cupin family protein
MEDTLEADGVYSDIESVESEDFEWGAKKTLVNARLMSEAELTFAIVWMLPGQEEPLHAHPNCEQIVHVLSGEAEFRLHDALYNLVAGDTIRVPRGVAHNAMASGWEPLKMAVCQSSPAVQTQNIAE